MKLASDRRAEDKEDDNLDRNRDLLFQQWHYYILHEKLLLVHAFVEVFLITRENMYTVIHRCSDIRGGVCMYSKYSLNTL